MPLPGLKPAGDKHRSLHREIVIIGKRELSFALDGSPQLLPSPMVPAFCGLQLNGVVSLVETTLRLG